jgi:hypothetical protein
MRENQVYDYNSHSEYLRNLQGICCMWFIVIFFFTFFLYLGKGSTYRVSATSNLNYNTLHNECMYKNPKKKKRYIYIYIYI